MADFSARVSYVATLCFRETDSQGVLAEKEWGVGVVISEIFL